MTLDQIADPIARRAYAKLLNAQGSYWMSEAMKALHRAFDSRYLPIDRAMYKRQAKACLQYAKADRMTAKRQGWKLP